MKLIKPKQYYYSNELVDCNILDIKLNDSLKDFLNISLTFYFLKNDFAKQVYSYVLKLDGSDYVEYNTITPNGNDFIIKYLKVKANIEVISEYIKTK
jgi:hypothetical protein